MLLSAKQRLGHRTGGADDGPSYFGFVRDADGSPVSGARVQAAPQAGGSLVTRSNSMGIYKIPGFAKEIDPKTDKVEVYIPPASMSTIDGPVTLDYDPMGNILAGTIDVVGQGAPTSSNVSTARFAGATDLTAPTYGILNASSHIGELYENGVSRALLLDYNDFVVAGAMGKFDVKDAKPCRQAEAPK